MPDVTETIAVKASPATLYSLVSDLPRMGEWSPECTKVSWSSGWRAPLPNGTLIFVTFRQLRGIATRMMNSAKRPLRLS